MAKSERFDTERLRLDLIEKYGHVDDFEANDERLLIAWKMEINK
jgi:hypothetical protein